MFDTRNGSFLLEKPPESKLDIFLHNYKHFNNISSLVFYFYYNNGFEPPRCKSFIMTLDLYPLLFIIALDSSAFLFGFGLLLFDIHNHMPNPKSYGLY